jgi:hypothetical protein
MKNQLIARQIHNRGYLQREGRSNTKYLVGVQQRIILMLELELVLKKKKSSVVEE